MHIIKMQTHKLLLDSFERECYQASKTDRFALYKKATGRQS